ncbi:MAG TPA: DUF423 domain-containing protein, partial [Thermodesulfobacteriota bacterium]|nr:DUF423 domain-containing protein [Thermodesulfobacteriota bacterium]
LFLAAASGFLSVTLGAFGAHSLKIFLDEYGKSIYEKAVLYQMFHTMALFAVGSLQLYFRNTSFSIAGACFLTGIVLFSGSLYVLALTGIKWIGAVTPIGGISFLLGWFFLGLKIIKAHP